VIVDVDGARKINCKSPEANFKKDTDLASTAVLRPKARPLETISSLELFDFAQAGK
jgi:hypothetical protein